MLPALKNKIFGSSNQRQIKKYWKVVNKINELESDFANLSEEQCREKTAEFKHRLAEGESLDSLLPEAFSLVRKAGQTVLGERHFDVQLIGGMALHDGKIAEMRTGEGKTLTSTLAVYLNALTGKGVHVVTVNDYLAKRDSEWMGRIFGFLGLTVGIIQHGMDDEERRNAYASDITYGTNNEFGFDFLRDNMKFDLADYVQRDHHYAIVDEVDSILIDESRTPLIISGPSEESTDKYLLIDRVMFGLNREWRVSDNPEAELVAKANNISIEEVKNFVKPLQDDEILVPGDYIFEEKSKNIQLTENGAEKLEPRLGDLLETNNLYDFENIDVLHHVNQSLKARYVFKRDVDYVVHENQVLIVDEFTGRLMPGRRFSEGLHQALEAKENVTIEKENQTLASITFQNFFRKYEKISGMTGTAVTEADEFQRIYGLGVVEVPTNRPMIRKDRPDVIYKTEAAKHRAIIRQIAELYNKKQPVLVGTISIERSELLSRLLKKEKIPHTVLNAKHHDQEAEIVSQAGQFGAVTIATNMAGRGTDIKLGDNVKELGGLFILGTERHESRRIDNQLRGRSGRQGDPGESRFYLSLEDDLLRIFGGERIAKLMTKLRIDEDEAIEHVLISKAIENSQKKVEAHNFEIRKHLLEYDDVMNRQREIIYKQRKEILGDEIIGIFQDMASDVIQDMLDLYCNEKHLDQWDMDGLKREMKNVFQLEWPEIEDNQRSDRDYLEEILEKRINELYQKKSEEFGEHRKLIERQILLEITDNMWKDHLLSMDHLKEGIGLQGYAQKNPLNEYKKEGFYLFSDLMKRISTECVTALFHVRLMQEPPREIRRPQTEMNMIHGELENADKIRKPEPIRKQPTIGRNSPCPCGSGKKYKNCHLREQSQAS